MTTLFRAPLLVLDTAAGVAVAIRRAAVAETIAAAEGADAVGDL